MTATKTYTLTSGSNTAVGNTTGTYLSGGSSTDWDTNIWNYFPIYSNQLAAYWNEQAKTSGTFPPYNLLKNSDNSEFVLSLAVAGFSPDELDVTVKDSKLIITGNVESKDLPEGFSYAHKGIAERSFTKAFTLHEYVEVKEVTFKNGMLEVKLQLVLPENKRPKKFQITSK